MSILGRTLPDLLKMASQEKISVTLVTLGWTLSDLLKMETINENEGTLSKKSPKKRWIIVRQDLK